MPNPSFSKSLPLYKRGKTDSGFQLMSKRGQQTHQKLLDPPKILALVWKCRAGLSQSRAASSWPVVIPAKPLALLSLALVVCTQRLCPLSSWLRLLLWTWE